MPSSPATIKQNPTAYNNDNISHLPPNITDELKIKLNEKISNDDTIPESVDNSDKTMPNQSASLNDDGLIVPKKLPNPVRENRERQELHRELLFNQKIGKNVLNQKSELQKALEKHKDHIARKELENSIAAQAPELEKVIADRAKRFQNNTENDDDRVISKEFLEARMKLKKS